MAVCSSVLQVSSGHSSVASRSHVDRKDQRILVTLCILQKWPLCGKLKHKATHICYAFSQLAVKVTAQATFVGQVCASLLLCSAELQKGSQECALAFKKSVKY